MKTFKKILVCLLVISLLPFGITAYAFDDPPTALKNIYGDGMLFKQNEEAIISGTCKNGATITVELVSADGKTAAKGSSFADKSGNFKVMFNAPKGSYKEYTVKVYENGKLFKELKNVVFGELWLASGQSNMQYELVNTVKGLEMFKNKEPLNKNVRALLVPPISSYNGSTERVSATPRKDIEGARWVTGENAEMYYISAAAYFFADKLQKELDMPIGVLNSSLGGSAISTWLSRYAIDGDENVKKDLEDDNAYIKESEWKEDKQSQFYDMTCNFNMKINPLADFRLSGMIWYQGETDITFDRDGNKYFRSFDLLQRSYTSHFNYKNGMLPIVFSSLAAYRYGSETDLIDMNLTFTEIQRYRPESRALISIYDIPLDYTEAMGAIHPEAKQAVGERMADSAIKMLYTPSDAYTTATVSSVKINDGAVYVSFNNTGKGLCQNGDKLFGFAIAGENGVYANAEAEIVSSDTVKIYSEYVPEPKNASYAYCEANTNANLYAEDNNGEKVPVAIFATDKDSVKHIFRYSEWMDCEKAQAWREIEPYYASAYFDTWTTVNGNLSFTPESAFSGANGLNITSASKSFTVSPVMTFKDKSSTKFFSDAERDFSDIGLMSFYVKNNGQNTVKLNEIRFFVSPGVWYSPAVENTNSPTATIPADGEWHKLTFDLNALYFDGNNTGTKYSNEKLDKINEIKFVFSSSGNSDISVDGFSFAPDTEADPGTRLENINYIFKDLLEFFKSLYSGLIDFIEQIFYGTAC